MEGQPADALLRGRGVISRPSTSSARAAHVLMSCLKTECPARASVNHITGPDVAPDVAPGAARPQVRCRKHPRSGRHGAAALAAAVPSRGRRPAARRRGRRRRGPSHPVPCRPSKQGRRRSWRGVRSVCHVGANHPIGHSVRSRPPVGRCHIRGKGRDDLGGAHGTCTQRDPIAGRRDNTILALSDSAYAQYRIPFTVGWRCLMETNVTPGNPGRVLLNSDMGEGLGLHEFGNDEELMRIIDVANVACGFHAGDPDVMDTDRGARCRARRGGRRAPRPAGRGGVRPPPDGAQPGGGRVDHPVPDRGADGVPRKARTRTQPHQAPWRPLRHAGRRRGADAGRGRDRLAVRRAVLRAGGDRPRDRVPGHGGGVRRGALCRPQLRPGR